MTRPIYEPSTSRALAAQGWGQRQLFRRPAPTSASSPALGIPDLLLSGGAATATTNVNWPVPFPDFATPHTWDDPVISDADGNDLFTMAITDSGDAGNDRWEVTTKREGWWANELITFWDEVASPGTFDIAGVQQRVFFTSGTGFAFDPVDYRDDDDWMIPGAIGGSINTFGFEDNGYLRTWMAPHWIPTNKTWQATGRQRTGVDRGLSGIKWSWWFIADDDLSTWTFDSV